MFLFNNFFSLSNSSADLNIKLQEHLYAVMEGMPVPVIEQRRQYNTTEWLCRFEAWLEIPK